MFRIWFNRRRQWIDIELVDTTPTTFHQHHKTRWGWFDVGEKFTRKGKFGDIQLVKSRADHEDLVVHELGHAWIARLRTRQKRDDVVITPENEEKAVELLDELVRSFYREYKKVKNGDNSY